MLVEVHFHSYFRDLAGCAQTTAELPAPATVGDLLTQLHRRFPRLAGLRHSTLVAVDVEYQDHDHLLQEGDQVSLFPPVQGG
jgi:molybdopterin converting factor small subunit